MKSKDREEKTISVKTWKERPESITAIPVCDS